MEPATSLLVGGQRDGRVLRIETTRHEPILVIQLDPRATFRDGPYRVHLRRPPQRSGTKPYAAESVEPDPYSVDPAQPPGGPNAISAPSITHA